MSTPCGKCTTCPCGTTGSQAQQQQPPPRPSPMQAQGPCPPEGCSYPQQQPQQAQQMPPNSENGPGCQVNVYQPPPQPLSRAPGRAPHVECACTRNRNQPAVQAPLADNYTCSRPPRQQGPPLVETRCNCREKPKQMECHCAPPVAPPPRYEPPPTHANVTCGAQPPVYTPANQPYYQRTNQNKCNHCRSNRKKCSIQ